MRSAIASLRSLTLPYGSTSGQRIVLDGVNGTISVYDENGDLLIQMSPEGFAVFDADGNPRVTMGTLFEAAYSVISFWSAAFEESTQGLLSLTDYGKQNRMVLAPGQQSSKGSLEITLLSTAYDNSNPSMIQAVGLTIDDAASPRPLIDLTGASQPDEDLLPRTVVYDLWYGMPNQITEAPDMVGSYGRGVVAYSELTSNDAARAANVNTNLAVTFVADATRRYVVFLRTQFIAGTAAVVYALELSEGGTVGAIDGTIIDRFTRFPASYVPAGSLTQFVNAQCFYDPGSSGSVTLRVRNGASGGTIQLNASGTIKAQMYVLDVGAL